MTTQQSEALRLADAVEALDDGYIAMPRLAAVMLRRQHTEIEALKAAGAQRDAPAEVAPEHRAKVDQMAAEAQERWASTSKDAERYRWLRETWCFSILEKLFGVETSRHPSAELDAAIDSAIAAQRGESDASP